MIIILVNGKYLLQYRVFSRIRAVINRVCPRFDTIYLVGSRGKLADHGPDC